MRSAGAAADEGGKGWAARRCGRAPGAAGELSRAIVAVALLCAAPAASAATVTLYPTASSTAGTVASPTSVYADDGTSATLTHTTTPTSLTASGFAATDLGTITGVTAYVKYASAGTSQSKNIDTYQFDAAVDGGTFSSSIVAASSAAAASGTLASRALGALTWAQVGTLAIRGQATQAGGNDGYTVGWDVAYVTVTYTPPMPTTLTVTQSSVLSANVQQGSPNKLLQVLDLAASGGDGGTTLTSLKVTRLGTSQDTDVAASGVKLWHDVNDSGTYDVGDAQVGTSQTFTAGTATFSGLSFPVNTGTNEKLLVTVDIAAAGTSHEGETIGSRIAVSTDVTVSSPDTVSISAPLSGNTHQITDSGDTLTVSQTLLGGGTVDKGTTDKAVMRLGLSAGTDTVSVSSLVVTRTGTAVNADTQASGIKLWLDDGDGVYEPATQDTQLSTPKTFASATVTFDAISGVTVTGGAPRTLWVSYSIAAGATTNATLGAQVAAAGAVTVGAPDGVTLSATPLTGSTYTIVAAPAANEITLVSANDPIAARACPGGGAQYGDRFGFTVTGAADTIATLTVQGLDANVPSPLESVEIRDDLGNSFDPAKTGTPLGDEYLFGAPNLPAPVTTTWYRLYFTPKPHPLMPDGEFTIVPTVKQYTSANSQNAATDPASTFTIDAAAPVQATWGTITPGTNQVQLGWTNPVDANLGRIVILRRQTATPFTEAIPDGTVPAEGFTSDSGSSHVVYSRLASAGTSFTDLGVLDGNTYVYRIYASDDCGNYNTGVASGSQTPTGPYVQEGSTVTGAPMISIVNPLKGSVVSGEYRVQIRVYNALPSGIAGITAGSLAYRITDTGLPNAGWTALDLAVQPGGNAVPAYDTYTNGTLTGRTYEVRLTPTDGQAYTLRARVSNAAASNVMSNAVPVVGAAPRRGDGKLVVRDNSAQLCTDCHAIAGHTSETTASADGSWSTTCRDCHTPHRTRNIALVAEQITPPARTSAQAPKAVVFYNKTGSGESSYASTAKNGPCQVCHTRTEFYRADGTSPGGSHDSGPCNGCHKHEKGLAASCTECHGDKLDLPGRNPIAGADTKQRAAPPVVATKAGQTVVAVAGGGAHVKHVNSARWRGAPLQCSNCHTMPNTHQATTQTDVAWTGLASAGGVTPTPPAGAVTGAPIGWTVNPTCTNYCHGATLAKAAGTNRTPSWSGAATQADCGTCHKVLPPLGGASAGIHPQNVACATCHGAGYSYAAGAGALADPAKANDHIDGALDAPSGCTACHGKLTGTSGVVALNGAPEAAPGYDDLSVDVDGKTNLDAPRTAGVGAHMMHVNSAAMTVMSAKGCEVCHVVPLSDTDTAHVDGGATEVAWTTPANAGGYGSPSYSGGSCLNYCHSSGKPMGLTLTTRSATWTSTANMGCTSCHADAGSLATNAHDLHVSKYACNVCHVDTTTNGTTIIAGGGLHVDGANSVGFDSSSAFVQGGTYTTPSCSNIYCHSNGTKRSPAYSSPAVAWNDTALGCTGCHGGPAGSGNQIATGKHSNHVNVAGTIGGAASTNFECGTCHAGTVDAGQDSPITGASNHVDRSPSVAFDPYYGGSFADGPSEGQGLCASNYCHSSGQDPAAAPSIIQRYGAAWNGAALDCEGCHGRHSDYTNAVPGSFASSAGEPNYASGGAAAPKANSHSAHVAAATAATDCVVCHVSTVAAAGGAILSTSTLHIDKTRQVTIHGDYDSGDANPANNYDPIAKRCSNVSCHGAGQPVWGGPKQTCSSCHVGTGDHDDFAGVDNRDVSIIDSGEWTSRGHGGNTAAGFEEFEIGGVTDRCVYCHDSQRDTAKHKLTSNPFRLRGASDASGATAAYDTTTPLTTNAACLNCHDRIDGTDPANGVDPDGAGGQPKIGPADKRIDAYHYGATHTAWSTTGGVRCWDCHDVHGDGSNVAMIHRDPLPTTTNVHGFDSARAATAVVFTTRGAGGYATTPARSGVCQVCHTHTKYYLWNSEGQSHAAASTDCIGCHDHGQPPNNAFKGAGACSGCHMGAASASSSTDVDEFPPVDGGAEAKSRIDPEDWLETGHGRTQAMGNYPQSSNPPARFPAPTTDADPCYYCHAPDQPIYAGGPTSAHSEIGGGSGTNPFRLLNTGSPAGTNKNHVCLVCHATGSPGYDPDNSVGDTRYARINRTTSKVIDATHYRTTGGNHDATHDGGALCWDCHDPHGDWNYGTSKPIAYMIQAKPTLDGDASGWGSPSGCPGACQVSGTVVSFVKDAGTVTNTFDGADYVTAGNAGVCQVCHESTTTDPTVNAVLYWKSDGSGSGHQNGEARCVACHAHQQSPATNAFSQATACNACHSSVPANGKHSLHVGGATPAYGDNGNYATTGAYGYGCGKCHADSPDGLAVHYGDLGGTTNDPYLVQVDFDWTSGSPQYTVGTQSRDTNLTSGLVFWTSTGTCLTYCHSSGQATPTYKSPGTWDSATAAMPADCTGCHGGNAAVTLAANRISTGSHTIHTNNASYVGANAGCAECHAATVSADRALTATTGYPNHVDGQRDVSATSWNGTTCASNECHSNGTETPDFKSVSWGGADGTDNCKECHGSDAGGFTSTYGEPSYAERIVNLGDDKRNSHSKHVHRTDVNVAKTQCASCHSASINADGTLKAAGTHLNGTVEITVGGAVGSYNPTGEACGTISCHANKNAEWGGQLDCWSCHGSATARSKDGSVGGTVDANLQAAPPVDASGNGSGVGVGAHLEHVNSGTYRYDALACADCHPTPGTTHDGNDDAAWSTLSSTNPNSNYTIAPSAATGYDATWEGNPSCTNWCHGDGLKGGGRGLAWLWTGTGTTCSSCHGQTTPASAAPALATANHPQNTACATCHGAGYATSGLSTTTAKQSHIDGAITKSRSGCTLCHGDLTATGKLRTDPLAMPGYNASAADTLGGTAASNAGVGAHNKHLLGTALRTGSAGGTAAACNDCHAVPASDTDVSHATGSGTGGARATITPSALATTDGASGVYAGSGTAATGGTGNSAGTCSVYCHGGGTKMQGAAYKGTNTTPSWTGGAAAQACGSCHKVPPSSSGHPTPYPATKNCQDCHPGYDYTPAGGLVALDKAKHVNGQLDGGGGPNCTSSSCHGAVAGSRRNVLPDFANGASPYRSHHVGNGGNPFGGSLTDNDCWVCHAEYDTAAASTGALHMNGLIELRDADNNANYFEYDKDAIAALGTAGANSGNATFRQEMSGRLTPTFGANELVGAPNYFTATCPSGSPNCKKGLDRFCISCHDKDGASTAEAIGETAATALNPFNDTSVTNMYDQVARGSVVDVASRVHETARQTNGTPIAAADRDSGYAPTGATVRGADGRNDPPEGVFSRHAIRGLSVSVYSATNAGWDTTTYWDRGRVAWSSTSVMACADCHTNDGVNGANGNAHGANTEYLLKNADGTSTARTAAWAASNCAMCHLSSYYNGGSGLHTNNGSDFQDSTGQLGVAGRVTNYGKGGSILGLACTNCHGGGPPNKTGATVTFPTGSTGATGFGTIHGTSQVLGVSTAAGTTRPAYRFTNGNSMRYYDPLGWSTTSTARTCSTLDRGQGDSWGACIQHGATTAPNNTLEAPQKRPLKY